MWGRTFLFLVLPATQIPNVMRNPQAAGDASCQSDLSIIFLFYLKQASLTFLGYAIRFNVQEVVVDEN